MGSGSSGGSAGSVKVATAGGTIKPVPTQVLGSASWQGMKVTAQAMTSVPFEVYNGTSAQVVKPGNSSFHLMVMLNDAYTDVPIPYATVWATIKKEGKVVFDERQWPMIARYMGPHYGNDVTLPGAGTYQLSLLISPPSPPGTWNTPVSGPNRTASNSRSPGSPSRRSRGRMREPWPR